MNLNPEQQAAVNVREGQYALIAGPGSGKTRVLTERYQRLVETGCPPYDILNLTFTKEAAASMQKRAGASKENFCTFHSLGYRICNAELGRQNVEPELRHRLLCKLCKKWRLEYKELTAFISKCRRNGISPAETLGDDSKYPYSSARAYKEYETERVTAGWTDFDSMLIGAVNLLEDPAIRARYQYRFVQIDESQDTEACQPIGTLVRKICGYKKSSCVWQDVPIETLKDGDKVICWNRRQSGLNSKKIQPISVSHRPFCGDLLELICGDKKTKVTPDHRVYATMNGIGEDRFVVYLMYRSDLGFRVGQCAIRYQRKTPKARKSMSGLQTRFREEKAEYGWILRVEKSRVDSQTWEQIISCNYGIPYSTYGDTSSSRYWKGTTESARFIFQSTKGRGKDCLKDCGLSFEEPLFKRESNGNRKGVSKRYFETTARNLIPELMSLPSTESFKQEQITAINKIPYNGMVYSLNVPIHHTYVADGLVVKNCQWRIARLLTEKYNNILAVGDRNQAIYGFRDAVVDFESLMKSIWPNTQVLYLGRNYRSHAKIVDYVRKKAPHASELNERMVSARPDTGPDIEYRTFNNETDEAEDALACAVRDPLNSIIIARTNRMLAPLENLCLTHNIKFHLLGKSGFWKQHEVLKAVDKLRQNPSLPLSTAVSLLWPQLESHYRVEDMTEKDNDALENLRTLRDISRKFNSVAEFVGYANRAAHARQSVRGVTLSTVHQAKGTEFTNVFVIGCRIGMMPHEKGELDEERRIFFVACSRAKDRLRLSFAGTPSMFIRPELSPTIMQKLEADREKVERITRV